MLMALMIYSSFIERSAILKELSSHGAQNLLEGGLVEGDENVRHILLFVFVFDGLFSTFFFMTSLFLIL